MDQPTAEHALVDSSHWVGEWTFEARWPSGEPCEAPDNVSLRGPGRMAGASKGDQDPQVQ
jgi:hypothetical protein